MASPFVAPNVCTQNEIVDKRVALTSSCLHVENGRFEGGRQQRGFYHGANEGFLPWLLAPYILLSSYLWVEMLFIYMVILHPYIPLSSYLWVEMIFIYMVILQYHVSFICLVSIHLFLLISSKVFIQFHLRYHDKNYLGFILF